jgi:hypothetical protein
MIRATGGRYSGGEIFVPTDAGRFLVLKSAEIGARSMKDQYHQVSNCCELGGVVPEERP